MFVLKLRARGGLLVQHLGALGSSQKRYVGRQWDPSLKDQKRGIDGGWPALPDGEEVHCEQMHLSEYAREVREGALWAGDEETAKLLGVKFDPDFGGEYSA